ncbi:uncharacterized protein SCDLUD_002483 [Saccharomycodes ludwigii]|uniref:uncharacterized protein n=1 Tax=Saccharomycodes ludwigii TaxID=36035 RepID=UPI001E8ACAB3|nr:hypothetical protein SCDLUD_002483 [Saccharomycodes ludwigii]KAH3901017.1 hypothetical protein SCDLUD_002483 [Saccharomycodes ludwigii]
MSDPIIEYKLPLYLPISNLEKRYKLFKLPNGLLCFLISDPTEKIASCSLTVATGAFNDPENMLGLAHLCEHMLLAGGSKEYTDPQIFHEEIGKNNGSFNAYTTGEQTTFYFEIPNTNIMTSNAQTADKIGKSILTNYSIGKKEGDSVLPFEKLLRIFVSFFKAPLFKRNLIDREIFTVNSEHDGNKTSTMKILYHATRLLSNKRHPFHRFSTGNLKTLSIIPRLEKIDVQKRLKKYFLDNFTVNNNMTMCLKGFDSLNLLTKYAIKHFSDLGSANVANNNDRATKQTNESNFVNFNILNNKWHPKIGALPCFSNTEWNNGILVNMKQQQQQYILRILYPIFTKNLKCTHLEISIFTKMWCELFSEKSEGSLFENFHNLGLLTDLVAYTSNFSIENDGLILQLTLTKSGWEKVTEIVFEIQNKFLPMILLETDKLAKYLSDLNVTDLLKFIYQDTSKSSDELCPYISDDILQGNFDVIDPKCLLKETPFIISLDNEFCHNGKGYEFWVQKAAQFQNFLNEVMDPFKMRIILMGDMKTLDINGTCNTAIIINKDDLQLDPYFEFEYVMLHHTFPPPHNPIKREHVLSSTRIYNLPAENNFLPKVPFQMDLMKRAFDASMAHSQNFEMDLILANSMNTNKPKLKRKDAKHEYWIKNEGFQKVFKSKSIISISLKSLKLKPSPSNTMMLEVLTELLGAMLSPKLYPAIKLGYSCEITPSSRGDIALEIRVSGFNKKLIFLLELILSTIFLLFKDERILKQNKKLFRKARINVRSKYMEASNENCLRLSTMGVYILLEKYMWTLEDRIDALEEDINIDSFQQFLKKYLNNKDIYVLLVHQGDIEDDEDESINLLIDNIFCSYPSSWMKKESCSHSIFPPETVLLTPGTNYVFEKTKISEDPNNAITYFVQTGPRDDELLYTLTVFTDFLLSLTLVPRLRFEKQLGYVVVGGLMVLTNSIGIHISCMSSYSGECLEDSIEEYLFELEMQLSSETFTNEHFKEKYIDGFIKIVGNYLENGVYNKEGKGGCCDLLMKIKPSFEINTENCLLGSQLSNNKKLYDTITLKRYNFDFWNESEPINVNYLKNLNLEEYLRFYREKISIFGYKTRCKLAVAITSDINKEGIKKKQMCIQVETFLKIKGMNIPRNDLEEMVDKSNGKPSLLLKYLYKYFKNKNERKRLMAVVLKEMMRILGCNFKIGVYKDGGNKTDVSNIPDSFKKK